MLLNQSQFNDLIKNIPSITLEINWDHEEGEAKLTDHEVSSANYLIYMDVSINAYGKLDTGDYYTPPSFELVSISKNIEGFTVFANDLGHEVKLSVKQIKKLTETLQESIIVE